MLTNEQRERLIGMVMMGMSSETACECLRVTAADVLAAEDTDPAFAQALFTARCARDTMEREIQGFLEDDD